MDSPTLAESDAQNAEADTAIEAARPAAKKTPKSKSAPAAPKRRARVNWATWNPQSSITVFHQTLPVGASGMQRGFGSWYARILTASIMLTDVLPQMTRTQAQAQAILDVVMSKYDAAHERLQDQLLEARELMRERGIKPEKAYTGARVLNVPFYNNLCFRFLQMVQLCEELSWTLDTLATFGLMKNKTRVSRSGKARGELQRLSLETVDVWKRAKLNLSASAKAENASEAEEDEAGLAAVEARASALLSDIEGLSLDEDDAGDVDGCEDQAAA